MSDVDYKEDRKYILESILQHKEDIKDLYKNDVEIKVKLQTLIVKMAFVMFVGSSVTAAAISLLGK